MINFIPDFKPETSLRRRLKAYLNRVNQIDVELRDKPEEWGRYQSEFNQEVNSVFRDLMIFEKENVLAGNESRVYKLKRFFTENLRDVFVRGKCLKQSLLKPYGYAGDFEIINDIYVNEPQTQGLDLLYDNYFQMSSICHAVRNRKRDFQNFFISKVNEKKGQGVNVLDLASGPCRDVFEVMSGPVKDNKQVKLYCFDADENAVAYGKNLFAGDSRIEFRKYNAVRIALMKNIQETVPERFDLIFSTGLFDYLDDKITVRLIKNLGKLLKPDGVLAISDVRDKFSNPSIYFMEWVADWNLIYRGDDEFRELFVEAGYNRANLKFRYEQQGMFQYVLARGPIS